MTVRRVMNSPSNPHTTTAYHPKNGNHCLRIPERAALCDSGFLVNLGDRFEVTFAKGGVYDYFCLPHEGAGMPGADEWVPVPEAARATFPSIASIMARKIVRLQQFSQNRASGRTT
jgi:plastocyanin